MRRALTAAMALLCLAGAGRAAAATVQMSVLVSPGTLSLDVGQVRTVTVKLDGSDQQPTVLLPLTISDSTGSGNGWHVTVTSTGLSTTGPSPKRLPGDATRVVSVSSTCAAGASCMPPGNAVAYPFVLPAGAAAPSTVKLIAARADTGLGTFDVVATLRVDVPATARAGSYTAALTIAVVSGP